MGRTLEGSCASVKRTNVSLFGLGLTVSMASLARCTAAPTTGAGLTATIVLLARSPLFQSCSPDEIQALAETAYPISFEPGEPLTVEGGESLECYVISEGEAHVTIGGKTIRRVGEYDVVGERGLLEERERTATVTADSEIISYAISRERLAAVLGKNPELAEKMLAYTKERYAD